LRIRRYTRNFCSLIIDSCLLIPSFFRYKVYLGLLVLSVGKAILFRIKLLRGLIVNFIREMCLKSGLRLLSC